MESSMLLFIEIFVSIAFFVHSATGVLSFFRFNFFHIIFNFFVFQFGYSIT